MMDIESMLLPIPGNHACGENLSFSTEFDAILAMQQEDDPTLDQGEWITPLKVADWVGVQERCAELLTQRTKDLRVAMWWTEACARNNGYAGLLHGLLFCEQLCVRFWDQVHPLPEDGDQEERAGNINWFLQRVAQISALCPVTQRRDGSHDYCLQELIAARKPVTESTQSTPPTDSVLTLERFGQALRDTPREFIQETLQTLEQCLSTLARWQAWLRPQFGEEGPNFVPAREALERACHEVRRLGNEIGLWKAPSTVAQAVAQTAGEQSSPTAGLALAPVQDAATSTSLVPIQSAEDALARLREIAAYFRRTQPHSPVAYLAEKAAQWGEMPLHDWLRAVVKDGGTLVSLQEMLGVSDTQH